MKPRYENAENMGREKSERHAQRLATSNAAWQRHVRVRAATNPCRNASQLVV